MRAGAVLFAAFLLIPSANALRAQAPQPSAAERIDESRSYWELRKFLTNRGYLGGGRELTHVLISDSTLSDAAYFQLSKFPTIRSLDLSHSQITDQGIASFGKLKSLENLMLIGTQVTDRGLEALLDLPKLKLLYLNSTQVTDAGLVHLEGLPLEELHLFGVPVTSAGLKSLSAIKSLRILSIANTQIEFKDFEAAGPKSVAKLYLDTRQFRDFMPDEYYQTVFDPVVSHRFDRSGFAADLFYAANDEPPSLHGLASEILAAKGQPRFPGARLESNDPGVSLVISNSTALHALLESFDAIPNLIRLTIKQTSVSELALSNRQASRLVLLDLTGTDATDALFTQPDVFDNLETLRLGETQVGDAALASLRQARLQRLTLTRTRVTDAGLTALSKHLAETLQELEVDFTRVTDQVMPDFEHCQELRILNLGGTGIGDRALRSVGKLANLESLNVELTRVTDAGLAEIGNLTQLKTLNLANTSISDAGLRKLSGCQSLQEIDVRNTKVTPVGSAWLLLKLPRLKVLE